VGTRRLVVTLGVVGGAVVLSTGACAPEPHYVRRADLDAWRGAPRRDLETNRQFAVLPLNKRIVSDELEVWRYDRCPSYVTDPRCVSPVHSQWAAVNCNGKYRVTECCHDVFVVRGDTVESSSLEAGEGAHCYTTCAMRPASRPCAPGDGH
jgi:hypothetical protein